MSASNLTPTEPAEVAAADASAPEGAPGVSNPEPDRATLLEQEVAVLKDQLLRRRAEFDNYRRRTERDQGKRPGTTSDERERIKALER